MTRRASPARRVLLRYLSAAVLVRLADSGARVALVLLAIERSHSAALGGALVAAFAAPHLLAAPAIGALADRVRNRRRLHVAGLVVVAASLAACGLLVGRAPAWFVVAIAAVGGCVGPLLTGGLSSLVALLLPAHVLDRAYGADGASYNAAGVAGPAIAAALAHTFNASIAMLALSVATVAGAAFVATLPLPVAVSGDRPGTTRELLRGLAVLWRHPTLRVVVWSSTWSELGLGAMPVVAALLALRHGSADLAGLYLSVIAASGLAGSVLYAWRPIAADRPDRVLMFCLLAIAVPLFAAAAVRGVRQQVLLFALSGFFEGPFVGALLISRDRWAPAAARTQVFTVSAGLRVAFSAVGAAVAGAASRVSPMLLLAGVAGVQLFAVGSGLLMLPRRVEPPAVT